MYNLEGNTKQFKEYLKENDGMLLCDCFTITDMRADEGGLCILSQRDVPALMKIIRDNARETVDTIDAAIEDMVISNEIHFLNVTAEAWPYVCVTLIRGGDPRFGWAKCHTNDKYHTRTGRNIATLRALELYDVVDKYIDASYIVNEFDG